MTPGVTIASSGETTLITSQSCSANTSFLSEIFEKIVVLEVNVGTVSLSLTQGAFTSLSFTIVDEDLGRMLQFTSGLQTKHEIRMTVSSGSNKITVSDQHMGHTPDIVAAAFIAAACVSTDVRVITTSEDKVSLLVTFAGYPGTLTAIEQAMREPQGQIDLGEILI